MAAKKRKKKRVTKMFRNFSGKVLKKNHFHRVWNYLCAIMKNIKLILKWYFCNEKHVKGQSTHKFNSEPYDQKQINNAVNRAHGTSGLYI